MRPKNLAVPCKRLQGHLRFVHRPAEQRPKHIAPTEATQEIRQAITSDDKLSTNAQNVKIIAKDGNVTLRGPVKSEQEKVEIEKKAKQVAGVKNVENQLEVAS